MDHQSTAGLRWRSSDPGGSRRSGSILAGLNRSDERFPTSSRYQYPSALFLLLVLAAAPQPAKGAASAIRSS